MPTKSARASLERSFEAVLAHHRHEIAVPLHAGPAVRHALTTERFRVRDLPGDLDDAGKLVLVRRLIREGLLQPLDQTQI